VCATPMCPICPDTWPAGAGGSTTSSTTNVIRISSEAFDQLQAELSRPPRVLPRLLAAARRARR
jgi:hypothetical protein